MMGVLLVLVVAVVLSCVAGVANVLNVRTHARSVSDVSALSAARSLYAGSTPTEAVGEYSTNSEEGACGMAAQVAKANGVTLDSCILKGDDIVITVESSTLVPFVPSVRSTSMAGPRECE